MTNVSSHLLLNTVFISLLIVHFATCTCEQALTLARTKCYGLGCCFSYFPLLFEVTFDCACPVCVCFPTLLAHLFSSSPPQPDFSPHLFCISLSSCLSATSLYRFPFTCFSASLQLHIITALVSFLCKSSQTHFTISLCPQRRAAIQEAPLFQSGF